MRALTNDKPVTRMTSELRTIKEKEEDEVEAKNINQAIKDPTPITSIQGDSPGKSAHSSVEPDR